MHLERTLERRIKNKDIQHYIRIALKIRFTEQGCLDSLNQAIVIAKDIKEHSKKRKRDKSNFNLVKYIVRH